MELRCYIWSIFFIFKFILDTEYIKSVSYKSIHTKPYNYCIFGNNKNF